MPLYRNTLTVQGLLTANSGIRVGNRYSISSSGGMDWAPASGVNDVNFYRAATGLLQTDYTINAGAMQIGGVDVAGTISAAGTVRPTDQSLVGWTFDPREIQGGTVQPTAGLAQVARVRALSAVATNILFYFTAGGSSLTSGQCFAALYNDAGALLGAGAVTADQSVAWATSGLKTCALSVAQGVTPYSYYRVLWWFNGTTGPTIARGANTAAASLNVGMSAPTLGYSTADTGLTTAAPPNIGSQTSQATAWWVGLS